MRKNNANIPFYKKTQIYNYLKTKFWILYTIVDREGATKFRHKRFQGYELNLDDPKTLNEKMQWLKLNTYYKNPIITKCTDKYAVRDYVKEKGCEEILNELYQVTDDPEKINWDALPNKFVLKSNTGSTSNIICLDKSKLDKENAKKEMKKWLKDKSYGLRNVEFSYEGIENKIVIEKYIETEDGRQPKDYKIFCQYGEPKFLYVASNRDGDEAKYDFFTVDWQWLPVRTKRDPNSGGNVKRPDNFEDMLHYAKILSKDFPLVRVDFYSEFGKVIFGELTFLSASGNDRFEPREYDRIFGDMFDIDDLVKG